MKTYNFSAGPGVMPEEVITTIKQEFENNERSHMSIVEISHRSKKFQNIIISAEQKLRQLMQIPDDYAVVFLQGGGSMQFEMMPLNFATQHQNIAVLDSGNFSKKAEEAARQIGKNTTILASTKDQHYQKLPTLPSNFDASAFDYLHIVTNSTIEGAAFHQANLPQTSGRLIADMSSNILAEPYNVSDFDAIFAGGQKNLGPAGVTVAIIKKSWLAEQDLTGVGPMMRYQNHIDKQSMYNTSPVFSVYALDLVLSWVIEQGGVAEMHRQNLEKSGKLYAYLDQSDFYTAPVEKTARSLTNIVFTTGNLERDKAIAQQAEAAGLFNLAGHRSVGGFRASLYNAQPAAAVDALIAFLQKVEQNA
ncbi:MULTISPECIES: 3-phosphoserine/phosphohydroxythreonine transaminase [Leuconostoc]|uniref:Phosphoserine aminotransferase n=2 Tax=Leuconostoc kimchii TaxID=136609 RepID=D5T126_LEUKI|nr:MULTISPECIES: 3-phosphoserine/phosphohydroxythreonine transaminase [Leuconostoc]ADG39975.1 phosphoserine aminotransferase [Leuconostoc kimchii IMSNU 11154]AEJ30226.1 3-phosphoserine/phosphohydroxythreonine aminotransferase [Leuconostoc sp. C2]QBR47309.1 3-phosphoserine/phosphohydroxythreonine transaminase [Leuconostoc kimchii]